MALDPSTVTTLLTVVLVGVIGGIIRVIASREALLPSFSRTENGHAIRFGCLEAPLVGGASACAFWLVASISNTALGIIVTALLAGYVGAVLLNRLAEAQTTVQLYQKQTDLLLSGIAENTEKFEKAQAKLQQPEQPPQEIPQTGEEKHEVKGEHKP